MNVCSQRSLIIIMLVEKCLAYLAYRKIDQLQIYCRKLIVRLNKKFYIKIMRCYTMNVLFIIENDIAEVGVITYWFISIFILWRGGINVCVFFNINFWHLILGIFVQFRIPKLNKICLLQIKIFIFLIINISVDFKKVVYFSKQNRFCFIKYNLENISW